MSKHNIVNHDANSNNEIENIPVYFQAAPKAKETYTAHINRSHSKSCESRNNWAKDQFGILASQHAIAPPNYMATIKFARPITLDDYSGFWSIITERVRYLSKKQGQEIAGYYTLEVEPSNCFHNHILLRTSVAAPKDMLDSVVELANGKTFGDDVIATCDYCEPIQSVDKASAYTVKLYQKVMIFKSNLKVNIVGSFGKYFSKGHDALRKEYHARCKEECHKRNLEFLVEHPEAEAEIASLVEFRLGFSEQSEADIRDDVITAYRKDYKQRQAIGSASEADKREASILADIILGLDYDDILKAIVASKGNQGYVKFDGQWWGDLQSYSDIAETCPQAPSSNPLAHPSNPLASMQNAWEDYLKDEGDTPSQGQALQPYSDIAENSPTSPVQAPPDHVQAPLSNPLDELNNAWEAYLNGDISHTLNIQDALDKVASLQSYSDIAENSSQAPSSNVQDNLNQGKCQGSSSNDQVKEVPKGD